MNNEDRGRKRAEDFRRQHGLGVEPVKDLFELVHACLGVDVLSMDAPDEEHGLTMKDATTGVVAIVVATTSHPMRQRTSIAHEVGHVIAGDVDRKAEVGSGDRSPAEVQADTFARHLLLPLDAVTAGHRPGEPVTEKDLSELVQKFEVSPAVAAIQLRQAGLVSEEQKSRWMPLTASHLAAAYGWLSQYRSLATESQLKRAPQRLMSRAVAGYHEGVVGLAELAHWYDQDPEVLAEELQSHPHSSAFGEESSLSVEESWGVPLFPSGPDTRS